MNEDKTKYTTSYGGISFFLTILFLILKLTGVIDWAWVWVFSPLWIGIGLFIIIVVIILLITAILGFIDKVRGC